MANSVGATVLSVSDIGLKKTALTEGVLWPALEFLSSANKLTGELNPEIYAPYQFFALLVSRGALSSYCLFHSTSLNHTHGKYSSSRAAWNISTLRWQQLRIFMIPEFCRRHGNSIFLLCGFVRTTWHNKSDIFPTHECNSTSRSYRGRGGGKKVKHVYVRTADAVWQQKWLPRVLWVFLVMLQTGK